MRLSPCRSATLLIIAALMGVLASTAGCQAYVAKKRDELKQHFLELAGDDETCRMAVETGFERCWQRGMAAPGADAMAGAIVRCLNEAARKECFSMEK